VQKETNRTIAELSVRKRKEIKLPTKWARNNINVTAYRCFTNYPEDESIAILRNVGNCFSQNTLSHPSRLASSTTLLLEPQNNALWLYLKMYGTTKELF
jgi:hypothetical protein